VAPLLLLGAGLLPLGCALLAAWDAWRMGVAPPMPPAKTLRSTP
jgi:hypothetical protein